MTREVDQARDLLSGRGVADVGPGLGAWLRERRLLAEVAALPGSASLPPALRREARLEREAAGLLAAARIRTRERCDRALRAAGVAAILLKGEAVIDLCHGDAARRPMADLDLLVGGPRRQAAAAALATAGFTRPGADTPLHDVFHDPATTGPGMPRGVAVEIHADVFPPPHPFLVDAEGALRRIAERGPGIHAPLPEDALALTGFSAVFHETDGRKSWLVLRDLALLAEAVVAGGRLAQWAAVAGTGAEAAALRGALRLASRFTGAPPEAADALGEARPETWRRALATRLALGELEATLHADPPRARTLTRRLAGALWHPSVAQTLRALAARAASPGRGGRLGRAARHARALGHLFLRGPGRGPGRGA